MIRCSIWMLPFDKTRFSQLNTVSADIVPHHRFSSVRAEETPQIVALNHILIATDFSVKLRVFNLQLGCAEFAVDGSVLGKLLLQTIDLRLELCSQPVCSVKSLLQFGFLFLGCNVLLCQSGNPVKIFTLHGNLGREGYGLRLNLPVCRGRSRGKGNAPFPLSAPSVRTPRAHCRAASPVLPAVPGCCRTRPRRRCSQWQGWCHPRTGLPPGWCPCCSGRKAISL